MGKLPIVDQAGQRDAAPRLRLSLVAQVRKLRTPGIGQSGSTRVAPLSLPQVTGSYASASASDGLNSITTRRSSPVPVEWVSMASSSARVMWMMRRS